MAIGELKCNPGNYQCGGACIPESKECRKTISDKQTTEVANGLQSAIKNFQRLSKASGVASKYGLPPEQAVLLKESVDLFLASKDPGGKKQPGDDLQSPEAASWYSEFYRSGGDKAHTPEKDVPIELVETFLAELKESLPSKEYQSLYRALDTKGSPTKETREAAKWGKGKPRAVAVLKSLMDNGFRDVRGDFLSWRSGMQLDHKVASTLGGTDTPDNWIWVSAPTNQVKGSAERLASSRGLEGEEAEKLVREQLTSALDKNAQMSSEEVQKVKEQGREKTKKKGQQVEAIRDNFKVMTPEQKAEWLEQASTSELRSAMKALNQGSSYRVIFTGQRGRKEYPTKPQILSILKASLGVGSSDDQEMIQQITNAIISSKGIADRGIDERLDSIFKSYPVSPEIRDKVKDLLSRS